MQESSASTADVFSLSQTLIDMCRLSVLADLMCVCLVDRPRQQLWVSALTASPQHHSRATRSGALFNVGARIALFRGALGGLFSSGVPLRVHDPSGDSTLGSLLSDSFWYAACCTCLLSSLQLLSSYWVAGKI